MFNIIIHKLNNNEDQEKSSPKDVSSDGLQLLLASFSIDDDNGSENVSLK